MDSPYTLSAFRFLNEDKFVARRSDLDYDDDRDGDEDCDRDWWKVRASVSRMYAITNVHIVRIMLFVIKNLPLKKKNVHRAPDKLAHC